MRQAASGKQQGRDYRELMVFQKADTLVLAVYRRSATFPPDERFGLTNQIRRAAVSIASNIVEGCSRRSARDFARFLEIAHGSADELAYQLSIAERLEFQGSGQDITAAAEEVSRMLSGLISSLQLAACDSGRK